MRHAPARHRPASGSRGFILLPVTLLLSLIAAMAYMGHRETALGSAMADGGNHQDKARYAAEAGLQRVTLSMHSKGCTGTYPWILSPVKDSAFGGASYTAHTGLMAAGSPVYVSSTGTYGETSVTLTRTIPMHKAATVTMALQPDASGLDTTVDSANSTGNAAKATMVATAGTSHPTLQFDLASIPAGSHVTSATLSTYAVSGSGSGTVALHRVTRAWTEAGATWASADGTTAWSSTGGDVHATAIASTAWSGGANWLNWDVTALADRWLKGSLPNLGVQLRAGTGLSNLTFTSSDGATATQRPKLAVTFLPPCNWIPPLVTLHPIADTDIDGHLLLQLSNFGAEPNLYLSKGTEARPMLKFDTSGIAPGTVIKTATLRLYFDALASGTKLTKDLTATVHTATKPWNELEASWLYRVLGSLWLLGGGEYNSTAITTKTLAQNMTPGQWIEFPVTAQVQSWIDGVTPNNGLLLRITTSSTEELIFSSREATSNLPELVVTFK